MARETAAQKRDRMAAEATAKREAEREARMKTVEIRYDPQQVIFEAYFATTSADRREQEGKDWIQQTIERLRRAADEIEREATRIDAGEWPSTTEQTMERAINVVTWMNANVNADGATRIARQITEAKTLKQAKVALVEAYGETDAYLKTMASRS